MDTRNEWRNQLIFQHVPAREVARRIALNMARRCPDRVAREDLVGAAMFGLTEAAERHDESRTEPFLSFAEHRIRCAVLDELGRGDMLPRRVRQVARKISNTIRELENAGEAPSEQQPRMNEPPSRLNFLAGSASLFVAEWTTLPHGQG